MKPKIPTIAIPKAQKAVKSKKAAKPRTKAKRKPRLPVMVGQPPMDATPPDIRDTRPTRPVPDERLGDPQALDHAAPKVVTPKPVSAKPAVQRTGRIVQGQTCTWLGDLAETGDDPENPYKPVCPHCGGSLINSGDQELTRMQNRLYELGTYEIPRSEKDQTPPRPHPNFVDFVSWMREQPTCWPSAEEAALDYRAATGKIVDPSR